MVFMGAGGREVPQHGAKESINTNTSVFLQRPFPLPSRFYSVIFLVYVHFACVSVHGEHVVLLDGRRQHQIPWDESQNWLVSCPMGAGSF